MDQNDATREALRSLMDRFAKAGWLTDTNFVTPEKIQFHLNNKGRRQFTNLMHFYIGADEKRFAQMNDDERARATKNLQQVLLGPLEDLMPPVLTADEKAALHVLVMDFKNKKFP